MAITYFIPDWDDRVDPGYNFITDKHTAGRNPYEHDKYAHEIYLPDQSYDGVLLSRAVIDANFKRLEKIKAVGSVHRYLRLPDTWPVLGDCGAFSYWKASEPPYQTDEILEYYQSLGFNYGVSIDHLIFAELEEEKERRWQITMTNAEEFYRKRWADPRFTFIPVGVAQGWDPTSYQRAAQELLRIGYDHIAIGGLVRSQTKDVIAVLQAVKEVIQPNTKVHLFGVTRPEELATFEQLGVTSFDSASRLRRAWMDGRRNYFLGNNAYTAIRVPYARPLAKKQGQPELSVKRVEQAALNALRAYDNRTLGFESTFAAVHEYAELTGKFTDRIKDDYTRTLVDRPWTHCQCAICKEWKVEVIIFRGNNRNRRRGFHNTWQLYQQLHSIPQQLPLALLDDEQATPHYIEDLIEKHITF